MELSHRWILSLNNGERLQVWNTKEALPFYGQERFFISLPHQEKYSQLVYTAQTEFIIESGKNVRLRTGLHFAFRSNIQMDIKPESDAKMRDLLISMTDWKTGTGYPTPLTPIIYNPSNRHIRVSENDALFKIVLRDTHSKEEVCVIPWKERQKKEEFNNTPLEEDIPKEESGGEEEESVSSSGSASDSSRDSGEF